MTKRTLEPKKNQALYIGGEWLSGYGKPLRSKDPFDGLVIYDKPAAAASDVTRAVRAAEHAFFSWSETSFEERTKILESYTALLKEEAETLSKLISLDTGKPQKEADAEVAAMQGKLAISYDAYKERTPTKTLEKETFKAVTRHRPHGVVAVLGPFNFPGHLPNGHLIPLLLAGNTIVFKPSEYAPSVGEYLVKLFIRAGLPAGVLNLLQGDGRIGKELAEHEGIAGLTFTGSAPTGEAIQRHFAKEPGKILALEMGGNNPLIFSSAEDLDKAAEVVIDSAFISAGQRCTCARRLILIRSEPAEKLLEKVLKRARKLNVLRYDENSYMGPLISEEAVIKALTRQEELRAHGGKVLLELKALRPGTGQVSCGMVDVEGIATLKDEELFAPLLQIQWAKNIAQAVRIASDTSYGLSAGLISRDEREYHFFLNHIRAGIVNWNRPTTGALSSQPFGGVGRSGNYRPAAYYAADFSAYPVASMEGEPL